MPKYCYQCDYCDKQWEEWKSISEPDPEECPHCEVGYPFKVPSRFNKSEKYTQSKKTGDITEQSIIDSREELKREIKELKNKKYDDI